MAPQELEDHPPCGSARAWDDLLTLPEQPDVSSSVGDRSLLEPAPHPIIALVVDPDPLRRARARRDLKREGAGVVITCAGPDEVRCPIVSDEVSAPCRRVESETRLVVLSPRYVGRLATTYLRRLPGAAIRVPDMHVPDVGDWGQ